MNKAHEYRFNLTLNPNDPLHRTAIHALNEQGRHKSQFVVNAITHYLMRNGTSADVPVWALEPDRTYIEGICREMIRFYLEVQKATGTQVFIESSIPEGLDSCAETSMM